MILVTAATGQYGRFVVEALLQKVAPRDVAVAGTGIRRRRATGVRAA